MVPVWLKAVRSKVLLQNHLYFAVGKLHEDELWTPKLYFMADSVKYIDRCLYNYVQREGSITHQADRDKSARDAKRSTISWRSIIAVLVLQDLNEIY